jgi:hypothetical protein
MNGSDIAEAARWLGVTFLQIVIAPIVYLSPLSRMSDSADIEILLSLIASGAIIYLFLTARAVPAAILVFAQVLAFIIPLRIGDGGSDNPIGIAYLIACLTVVPVAMYFLTKRRPGFEP